MSEGCGNKDRIAAHLGRMVADALVAELRSIRPLRHGQLTPASLPLDDDFREVLHLDSLDLMRCATAIATLFNVYDAGLEDLLLGNCSLRAWTQIVARARLEAGKDLTFASSGTTGKPKHFRHTASWLEQEANAWAKLLPPVQRVVACVPSHHVYGTIWTAILPEVLQVPVLVLGMRDFQAKRFQSGDLVVAVPQLWMHAAVAGHRFAPHVHGVSSTAPLEPETDDALRRQCGLASLWHIYGSSETAGLAWSQEGGAVYEWLEYCSPADQTSGESQALPKVLSVVRQTPDGGRVALDLPNEVQPVSQRHFRLGERTDDTVKIAGHRLSLAWLREQINSLPQVAACAVRMDHRATGQERLKVLVVPQSNVGSQQDFLVQLEKRASEKLPAYAVPSDWALADQLPTNAMGKLANW